MHRNKAQFEAYSAQPAQASQANCPYCMMSTQQPHHGKTLPILAGLYRRAERRIGRTPSTPECVATSVRLTRFLEHAAGERVTVAWLMERLGERSFGLTLFLLAHLAFAPGAATVSSVLTA